MLLGLEKLNKRTSDFFWLPWKRVGTVAKTSWAVSVELERMQATNLIELAGLCTGICDFDKSFQRILGHLPAYFSD